MVCVCFLNTAQKTKCSVLIITSITKPFVTKRPITMSEWTTRIVL